MYVCVRRCGGDVPFKPATGLPLPHIRPRHTHQQASESAYFLAKARRLRDATLKLSHAAAAQAAVPLVAARQGPLVCVGGRVERGEALPEVEVRGGRERGEVHEGGLLEGAVLRHAMEGMGAELARELMHM